MHVAILTILMNYPVLFPTVRIVITDYIFQRVSLLAVLEHVSRYSEDIKYWEIRQIPAESYNFYKGGGERNNLVLYFPILGWLPKLQQDNYSKYFVSGGVSFQGILDEN